jgi:hypothetical protein
VFRTTWGHGVNGQAQVIRACSRSSTPTPLIQDKDAMAEAVANVRWLIAAGIRDFQAVLDALGKLQSGLPQDAQHPTNPTTTTRAACGQPPPPVESCGRDARAGTSGEVRHLGRLGTGHGSEAGRGVGAAVRLRRWGVVVAVPDRRQLDLPPRSLVLSK